MSTERCQLKRTAKNGTIRTMSEPAAKLRQLRISMGFATAKDAAQRYGWNVNTYKSHENGMRPLSKKAAADYAKAYKVLPGWLMYGTGPKSITREVYKGELRTISNDLSQQLEQEINLAYRKIPRLDWEIMANLTDINVAIARAENYYLVPADNKLPPISFALKISDDSMTAIDGRADDSFRTGDELILSPQKTITPGDFVVARVFARNETVFRQYRESGYDKQGRKIITLHALNPSWANDTIVLDLTGEIIARLIRHSRDYS